VIVAILGPDGSGKSTIADIVVAALSEEGLDARHHAHRFGVLPPLTSFRRGSTKPDAEDESKRSDVYPAYDMSENPPLRSFVYVTWYGIDYFLGGIFQRVSNLFVRRKRAAIFARYFYDYYYQSNNRRLPDGIKRLIETIVPRPQFIFFLDRDAQEIHNGKPELPVEEIVRQQQVIRDRLGGYHQFHIVDARHGAEDAAEQILRLIAHQRL
jgi:thymidylate kinase